MTTATMEATGIAAGWHEGLTLEQYLAIPALSASALMDFRRSPAHYRWAQENPKDPTPAMLEGTALHMALLEPHLFADRYVALGQCDAIKKGDGQRCTNQGIVLRGDSSFCGVKGHDPSPGEPMPAGVHVMPAEALDRIEGMKRAVLAHPEARQFFRGRGRSEVTGVWRDEETGVLCKIRLDRDIDRAFIHADVKSTGDASEEVFRRQIGRMGYLWKSAWYRRGMAALGREATASVLIAVESQPPHGVAAYLLDEDDLTIVGREIDRYISAFRTCLDADFWPGYDTGLRPMKLKPWDLPDGANDTDIDPEHTDG